MGDAAVAEIVEAVTAAFRPLRYPPRVHLFGVYRPSLQDRFRELGISSFDSATYFRKAWLRSGQIYLGVNGAWYAAIRVPMTTDARTRARLTTSSSNIALLEKLKARALGALHEFDSGKRSLASTLGSIKEYDSKLPRDIVRASCAAQENASRSTLEALFLPDMP